ncbi:MAG: quinolinate synthase NadA, partial [Chloroflexi bacterium]|nr:quinolinate synthase NadA [Chloroflexota bacterium]
MVSTIAPGPALVPQLQCESDVGIDTVPLTSEVSFGSWQRDIPEAYHALGSDELVERIEAARAALGDRAVVLGHHYQREDIIRFADERGDSFMLAQYAAARPESEFVVFSSGRL